MGARVSTERDDDGSGTASKQSAVHDEVVEVRKEGEATEELSVHFGYQCQHNGASGKRGGASSSSPVDTIFEVGSVEENTNTFSVTLPPNGFRTSSFSSLSGAALGANATLANSSICNGKLGEEILPGLDSPKTFRKLDRTSSLKSELSSLKVRNHVGSQSLGDLASYESSSFLHAGDVQMAGGAAGEDRVQAVCSEDQGWLFCGIYDGFNGRDAADFLAGTLYENIGLHLRLLEHQDTNSMDTGVLDGLREALWQTESDFLEKVEQEMQERPDLVMVGSCVLVVLMYGRNLYTLNLGDSRAVLATSNAPNAMVSHHPSLYAVALTERQVVEDSRERERIMKEHPEDPRAISNGRLKGKLRVTRAFGAGYLKKVRNQESMLLLFLRIFLRIFLRFFLKCAPGCDEQCVDGDIASEGFEQSAVLDYYTVSEPAGGATGG
jgi:serine/threonine protein phosphatase PrpC